MFQEAALLQGYAQLQSANDRSGGIRLAVRKWRDARLLGQLGQVWSLLTGRSCRLLDLSAVRAESSLVGGHNVGIRTVAISRIQGSEGRSEDFDREFRPLQLHNRGRWLSVANARQRGVALPPVELIQIGDIYFVRDGHHRISVARAFGQDEIEADVTVWETDGPRNAVEATTARGRARKAA
jgi:hypothetical protein